MAKPKQIKSDATFSFHVLLLCTLLIAIFITMFSLLKGTNPQKASAGNSEEIEYYYIEE